MVELCHGWYWTECGTCIFRVHTITETWQEGKDVVQRLFDSTEGCDVVCLQKCNMWLPLTQGPRYIGQGEEVSSNSNNVPEHRRNGSVCDLRAKKTDTMARQSLVKNIQLPAPDGGMKGTSIKNDNNKTTPQEDNTQQEISQKIQECEEHIERVMAVLEAMDVEHPNYHNKYLSLYEQILQESVLNKTGMIQFASFIIYTMHPSTRLQTHHQPLVLLVNDIHAVLPNHVYEQPLPLLQFRLLPSHTLNIHTLLYMYVICQTKASEPALP